MTTLLERLLNTVSSRFRVNAGDWFVGDLTLQQGDNVDLQKVGNVVTVSASLASKTRLRGNAAPYVSGDLTLASGAGVDIAQVGSTITFSSSAAATGVTSIQSTDGPDLNTPFSGEIYFEGNGCEVSASDHVFTVIVPPRTRLRANAGAYVAGDLSFVGAGGASVSEAGGTFTFRALPAPYAATLSGDDLLITAPSTPGAAPAIRILGRTTTAFNDFAGLVEIKGGSDTGAGWGGDVLITGGDGVNGASGVVRITGGTGSGSGSGAPVVIKGGEPGPSGTGIGGALQLLGGDGSTTGGDVQIAGGDGTAKGAVRFGYVSSTIFTQTWAFTASSLMGSAGLVIGNRLWEQSGGIAATPWVFRTDLTAGTLATAISNTVSAYEWKYDFSDTSRKPLEIQYDRAVVSGKLVHKQAVNSKIRVEVDPVDVDTASTTATTISSYTVGVSEMVTVTATLQHDNGTTNGRTVYTHTFRSSSGGTVTATGSAEDMSLASKSLGHTVTITATSGVISVKVVAAAATATKHRGQVSYEIGSNA